jgi:DNA-binding transcriptional regulator GbsR (MarR family)
LERPSQLHPVVRRFVEDAGSTTQTFGMGRVVGQIYAFLYFSSEPKNLSDLQQALGISKGSASTGVRQLEQWEAVRRVWIRGDRKDYYEANDWFGKILKRVLTDTVAQRMSAYTSLIDEADEELSDPAVSGDGEGEFLKDRVARLRRFQDRARAAWENPLVQRLLR